MPAAWCVIREAPHYRRWAFLQGLQKTGYDVQTSTPPAGKRGPDDLLVIWNRYGNYHEAATTFERGGGTVIVAENGYIGKDAQGRQHYALSLGWHQRPLVQPSGPRFEQLGVTPAPWRGEGKHVLVCAQRGFGVAPHAQPHRWPGQVADRLKALTRRPVVIRPHPEDKNVPPRDMRGRLEEDLAGCHAVVVWSSTAGVKALLAGVPVFHAGPNFIAHEASRMDLAQIEAPFLGDRATALERVAWGQWSIAEIEKGEPFALWKASRPGRDGSQSPASRTGTEALASS